MSLTLVLAHLALLLVGPGDLVFVESDIRDVEAMPWMAGSQIIHIESDCFLALTGNTTPTEVDWLVVDTAPIDLDRFRILYTAQYGEIMPSLPGEIMLTTDDFILIRLPEPEVGPVEIPGIGFLRPLRVHHERSHAPIPDVSWVDTVLVDQMVDMVSEDSIQAYIGHMQSYGTRYMFSPEYDACADWADTWMASYGILSEQQTFYYSGDSMSNVIGEIVGLENPERIYIICGHLDSYSSNPNIAPGADDNASGSSAVLEAARIMSQYSFRNTVKFVLFAAEEAWMVGSEYYVSHAYQQGDDIQGAINLDMVLYAPNISDSVYIPYDAQSEPLAINAGDLFAEYSPSIFPRIIYNPGAPSDHASFWMYGYTAIEIAEGSAEEIWGGYNPYYHQGSDLLINYLPSFPYGTDMIRASIGLIASLADPIGPSSVEGGVLNPDRIGVYPNPCHTGSIRIQAEGVAVGEARVFLMDLSGRTVAVGALDGSGVCQLDLPSLPNGVYSVICPDAGMAPVRFVLIQ